MKIICPSCKHVFEEAEAIVKPRKEIYKWYEISSNVTLCPNCRNRFEVDISIPTLIFLIIVFGILIFFANSKYNLAVGLIMLALFFLVKKFKRIFVVIKKVN